MENKLGATQETRSIYDILNKDSYDAYREQLKTSYNPDEGLGEIEERSRRLRDYDPLSAYRTEQSEETARDTDESILDGLRAWKIGRNNAQMDQTRYAINNELRPRLVEVRNDLSTLERYKQLGEERSQIEKALSGNITPQDRSAMRRRIEDIKLERSNIIQGMFSETFMDSFGEVYVPEPKLIALQQSREADLATAEKELAEKHAEIAEDLEEAYSWGDTSAEYKRKQTEEHPETYFNLLHPVKSAENLWYRSMENMGTSAANMEYQIAPYLAAGFRPLAKKLLTKVVAGAAVGAAGGSVIPIAGTGVGAAGGASVGTAMAAYDLVQGAIMIGSNILQGMGEAEMETFTNTRNAVKNKMIADGTYEAFISNLKQNPSTKDSVANKTEDEILSGLLDGSIGTLGGNAPEFEAALDATKSGQDRTYWQNLAITTTSNIVSDMIVLPLWSKGLVSKAGSKILGKVGTGAEILLDPVGAVTEVATDLAAKRMKKWVTTRSAAAAAGKASGKFGKIGSGRGWAAGSVALGGATRAAGLALNEAVEEGAQYRTGQEFERGEYEGFANDPWYRQASSVLTGATTSKFNTAATILAPEALYVDPLYSNDSEYWENVRAGATLAVFNPMVVTTGAVGTYHGLKDAMAVKDASAIVGKYAIDEIERKDKYTRAVTYGSGKTTGKEEKVLDGLAALSRMKDLPDGLTRADIEDEIQYAQKAFSIKENPGTKVLAEYAQIPENSDAYGRLVALRLAAEDDVATSRKNVSQAIAAENVAFLKAASNQPLMEAFAKIAEDHQIESTTGVFQSLVEDVALTELTSSLETAINNGVLNTVSLDQNPKAKHGAMDLLARYKKNHENVKKELASLGSPEVIATVKDAIFQHMPQEDYSELVSATSGTFAANALFSQNHGILSAFTDSPKHTDSNGVEVFKSLVEEHRAKNKDVKKSPKRLTVLDRLTGRKSPIVEATHNRDLVEALYNIHTNSLEESRQQAAALAGVDTKASQKAPVVKAAPGKVDTSAEKKTEQAEVTTQPGVDTTQPATQPSKQAPTKTEPLTPTEPVSQSASGAASALKDMLAEYDAAFTGGFVGGQPVGGKRKAAPRKGTVEQQVASVVGEEVVAYNKAQAAAPAKTPAQSKQAVNKAKQKKVVDDPLAGGSSFDASAVPTKDTGKSAKKQSPAKAKAEIKDEPKKPSDPNAPDKAALQAATARFKAAVDATKRIGFAADPKRSYDENVELIASGIELVVEAVKFGTKSFMSFAKTVYEHALERNTEAFSELFPYLKQAYTNYWFVNKNTVSDLDTPSDIEDLEVFHVLTGKRPEEFTKEEKEVADASKITPLTRVPEDAQREDAVTHQDLVDFDLSDNIGIFNTYQYRPYAPEGETWEINGERVTFSPNSTLPELLMRDAAGFTYQYAVVPFDKYGNDGSATRLTKWDDPRTWDYSRVSVIATYKDGRRFFMTLKSPSQLDGLSQDEQASVFPKLRAIRESIISKFVDPANPKTLKKGVVIRPGRVVVHQPKTYYPSQVVDGKRKYVERALNSTVYKRALHLGESSEEVISKVAFSEGLRGSGEIEYVQGRSVTGLKSSTMGGLYYIVPGEQTVSGQDDVIKLQAYRLSNNPKLVDIITEIVATQGLRKSAIRLFGNTDLQASDIIDLVLHHGPTTFTSEKDMTLSDAARSNLIAKQLGMNERGTLTFGEDNVDLGRIAKENPAEYEKFKSDFKVWLTENATFHLPVTFKEQRPFYAGTKIKDMFDGRMASSIAKGNGRVEIAPGIVFTSSDLEKTYLQWYYETGLLQTSLNPEAYVTPFVIAEDIKVENVGESPTTEVPKTIAKKREGFEKTIIKDKDAVPFTAPAREIAPAPVPEVTKLEAPELSDVDKAVANKRAARWKRNIGPAANFTRTGTSVETGRPIDARKEKEFLKKKLGLTDEQIEFIDLAISSGTPSVAGSHMRVDAIRLLSTDPEGTAYHEAYHRVALLLLSPEERANVYRSYRKEKPQYKGVSDKILEELIAEDFRAYMLTNVNRKSFVLTEWFRKLAKFVRSIAGRKRISDLFSDINAGKYAGVAINPESAKRFAEAYDGVADFTRHGYRFKTLRSLNAYNKVIEFLVNDEIAYNLEGGDLMLDATVVNLPFADIAKALYMRSTDETISEFHRNVAKELYENFEILKKDMRDYMAMQGFVEQRAEKKEQDDEDTESVNLDSFDKYDRISFEVPKLFGIRPSVKFFLSSIVDKYYDKNTKQYYDKVNPETGFPMFVSFNEAWRKLTAKVFDANKLSEGQSSVLGRLAKLAETDAFFRTVYEKLSSIDNTALQTQVYQTITGYYHNFTTVGYFQRGTGKAITYDAQLQGTVNNRNAKEQIKYWNDAFFDLYAKKQANGSYEIDPTELKTAVNALTEAAVGLNKLPESATTSDLNDALNKYVSALNALGISVNLDTLSYMIDTHIAKTPTRIIPSRVAAAKRIFASKERIYPTYPKGTPYAGVTSALNALTNKHSKASVKKTIDAAFTGETSILPLALANHSVNATTAEDKIYGPRNATFYPYSKHNYITIEIEKLNRNREHVRELLKAPTNFGSMALHKLATDETAELRAGTLINITEFDRPSPGTDYRSAPALETFLAKLVLTENDVMPLPVMSDKKTYMPIEGLKLFSDNGVHVEYKSSKEPGVDPQVNIRFQKHVIDQFLAYQDSEYQSMLQYFRIKSVEDRIPDNQKYLSYLGTPGKHGGGSNMRMFRGYYRTDEATGKVNYVPFSSLTDAEVDAYFEEGNIAQRREDMQNLLIRKAEKEVDYLKSIGVLRPFAANVGTVNALIPENIMASRRATLKKFVTEPLSKMTESEAVAKMVVYEFTINNLVSMFETAKLFSKDLAFSKNYRASVKRNAIRLSTGDRPRLDFNADDWFSQIPRYKEGVYYTVEIKDIMTSTNQPELTYKAMYDAYVSEYLYNSGMPSDQIEEIIDPMNTDDLFFSERVPADIKAMAQAAVERDISLYVDLTRDSDGIFHMNESKNGKKNPINQADGAAYCSPQMYKAILHTQGMLTKEVSDAIDYIENTEAPMRDIVRYQESLAAAMHPLKMVYAANDIVDIVVGSDSEGNPIVERLNPVTTNKMAIFPLFKVFALGDLKPLYDRMTSPDAPLDMALMSSAVKEGGIPSYSYYVEGSNQEAISEMFFRDNNNQYPQLAIKKQYFDNLLNQMPIEAHEQERRMFVTQAMKTNYANVRLDGEYMVGEEKVSGQRLVELANEAIDHLSDLGKARFARKYSVAQHEDGRYYFSKFDELSEALYDDMCSSGISPETAAEVSLNAKGEFKVPLSASSISRKLVTKIISKVNRETVDIMLPGGTMVQMSSFGMKGVSEKDAATYSNRWKRPLNNGNKLKMRNHNNAMEAVISINLFRHVIPNYENLTFEQAREWLFSSNIIGEFASHAAMGYRVPTQGPSSIAGLSIVDVVPSQAGDLIILPDEFTARTGSDFDIDKLYIARYNYDSHTGRKVEYTLEDGISEMTQQQAENLLLDTLFAMILDPKNAHDSMRPLDIPMQLIKNIVAKYAKVKDSSEPLAEYEHEYQDSLKMAYATSVSGIGPFAWNLPHHVLGQMTKLSMAYKSNLPNLVNLHGVSGKDGIHIVDWLSAMVSAHVDVANDDAILESNVNSFTYNVVNLLLRTGAGENTLLFVYQDIIRDLANAYLTSRGNYGYSRGSTSGSRYRDAKAEILKNYQKKAVAAAKDKAQKDYVGYILSEKYVPTDDVLFEKSTSSSPNKLEQTLIGRNNKNFDYYIDQLKYYRLLEEITPYADAMSDLVKHSQIDTKRTGKNAIQIREFIRGMEEVKLSPLFAAESVDNFYSKTFLQKKLDNGAKFLLDILSDINIPAKASYYRIFRNVLTLANLRKVSDEFRLNEILNAIDATWKAMCLNPYAGFNSLTEGMSSDAEYLRKIRGLFVGDNTMAKRLELLKDRVIANQEKYAEIPVTEGRLGNLLLDSLKGRIAEGNIEYLSVTYSEDSSAEIGTQMREYWQEMLESPNEDVREFANDLILYAIYTGHGNKSMNSLFGFIPETALQDLGFYDNVRSLEKLTDGEFLNRFQSGEYDELFLNNWTNDNLVPEIHTSNTEVIYSLPRNIKQGNNVIRSKQNTLVIGTGKQPIYEDVHGNKYFQPYIKIGNQSALGGYDVFKYQGNLLKNGNAEEVLPVYVHVNKKGFLSRGKVKITEYLSADYFENPALIGFSALAGNNTAVSYAINKDVPAQRVDGSDEVLLALLAKQKTNKTHSNFIRLNTIEAVLAESDAMTGNIIVDEIGMEHETSENYPDTIKMNDVTDNVVDSSELNTYPNLEMLEDVNAGYASRTRVNASADATIAIAVDFDTPGEKLTKRSVREQNKKYLALDGKDLMVTDDRVNRIVAALNSVNATSLNIAGNDIYTYADHRFTQEQLDTFVHELLSAVINNPNLKNNISHVRTGGQTGIDEAGAKAAMRLGIPTTILAPKGWVFRRADGKDVSSEAEFKARFVEQTERTPIEHAPSVSSYSGDITPSENTIFVFGSNPEGRHGKGAAKTAVTKFGAVYGNGEGLQGNSYALPTKDLRISKNRGLRSISEDDIIKSIQKLYNVATENPSKQFMVAYRNTTEASLNGYTGIEMIEMFKAAGEIPSNVLFSQEWVNTGLFDENTTDTASESTETNIDNTFNDNNEFPDTYRNNCKNQ